MSTSFDWVEHIPPEILDLEQKPQFIAGYSFPWKGLNLGLKKILGKEITITSSEMRWLLKENLFAGIGANPQITTLFLSPLQSKILWVMSKQDIQGLLAAILELKNEQVVQIDPEIFQGFSHFLTIETLDLIDNLGFTKSLSPRLAPQEDININQISESFRIDISIKVGEKTFWGFLFISDAFRKEWKKHISFNTDVLDPATAEKISIDLCLEVGKTELTLNEWKEVNPGDFIILDQCFYDPETKKGRLFLSVNEKTIFRAKIKEEGIKILEYPLFEMQEGYMEKDFDDEDDDELEDEEELTEEDEDDDFFGDLDDDEQDEEEVDENEDEDNENIEILEEHEPESVEKADDENGFLQPDNIPIQLTVEVGRIKMTALELMNLQPGNLIDLKVSPEQGVNLVINGKKVGKGELIKMGEVLGVRILKL